MNDVRWLAPGNNIAWIIIRQWSFCQIQIDRSYLYWKNQRTEAFQLPLQFVWNRIYSRHCSKTIGDSCKKSFFRIHFSLVLIYIFIIICMACIISQYTQGKLVGYHNFISICVTARLNHINFIIHLILHQHDTIKIIISSQHFVYYKLCSSITKHHRLVLPTDK